MPLSETYIRETIEAKIHEAQLIKDKINALLRQVRQLQKELAENTAALKFLREFEAQVKKDS